MIWVALLASFAAGVAFERARARNRITKRKAALHELHMQLTGPLDFALCDRTNCWQAVR